MITLTEFLFLQIYNIYLFQTINGHNYHNITIIINYKLLNMENYINNFVKRKTTLMERRFRLAKHLTDFLSKLLASKFFLSSASHLRTSSVRINGTLVIMGIVDEGS